MHLNLGLNSPLKEKQPGVGAQRLIRPFKVLIRPLKVLIRPFKGLIRRCKGLKGALAVPKVPQLSNYVMLEPV